MQGDVKDWNENLLPHEKHLVGNILLGFAQTECAVSDYWTTMVTTWFPKHEIKQMAMMFGSQETIHATAYSYLNETLGLEDFEAFLHEPAIAEKFDMLTSTSAPYTHEDLAKNPTARKEVARSLAIFSAFAAIESKGFSKKFSKSSPTQNTISAFCNIFACEGFIAKPCGEAYPSTIKSGLATPSIK